MGVLAEVKPNSWNPNSVPEHKLASIRESIQKDGWLDSQPILVWESDTKGRKMNIIIDGEHRWRVGTELGLTEAPMVFIKRISEAYAKSLTIKLDNNRGTFNEQPLAALIRELMPTLEVDDLALTLGFTQVEMNKLLELPEVKLDPIPGVEPPGGRTGGPREGGIISENSITKMVPIYMDKPTNESFNERVKAISEKHNLETVSHVMMFVLDEFWKTFEPKVQNEGETK